jgi:hypothetical protein
MINKLRQLTVFITLFVVVLQSPALNAKSLRASVDRNVVAISDIFTLTLIAQDIITLAQPDFSGISSDFDVISQSVSHNIENINGVNNQSITWKVQLKPKKLGTLLIPSFSLSGEQSNTLELLVEKTVIAEQDNKDFQLQLLANKTSAKVNEQIIITLRLMFAKSVSGLEANKFVLDDARIEKLADKNYETTINGRNYGVYELSYAVFVTEPKAVTIPVQQVNIGVGQRSFFNNSNSQTLALQSNSLQINVNAIEGAKLQNVLVADNLELTESWSGLNGPLNLGDSVTREITLQATGVLAHTITPITLSEINGLKIYPEPANKKESKTARGIAVTRSRSFAIVATSAGDFVVPEVLIQWWNTQTQQFETAVLPEKKLTVKPAATVNSHDHEGGNSGLNSQLLNPKSSTTVDLQKQHTQPLTELKENEKFREPVIIESAINNWLLAIIALLLFIVIVLVTWLLRTRKSSNRVSTNDVIDLASTSEKVLFNKLSEQVDKVNDEAIYNYYRQWKQAFAIDSEPTAEFKYSLMLLEQTLYSNTKPLAQWDTVVFKKLLNVYRKQLIKCQSDTKSVSLTLYQEKS